LGENIGVRVLVGKKCIGEKLVYEKLIMPLTLKTIEIYASLVALSL